jgi:hypothetical protein
LADRKSLLVVGIPAVDTTAAVNLAFDQLGRN